MQFGESNFGLLPLNKWRCIISDNTSTICYFQWMETYFLFHVSIQPSSPVYHKFYSILACIQEKSQSPIIYSRSRAESAPRRNDRPRHSVSAAWRCRSGSSGRTHCTAAGSTCCPAGRLSHSRCSPSAIARYHHRHPPPPLPHRPLRPRLRRSRRAADSGCRWIWCRCPRLRPPAAAAAAALPAANAEMRWIEIQRSEIYGSCACRELSGWGVSNKYWLIFRVISEIWFSIINFVNQGKWFLYWYLRIRCRM